jgi:RNA polymerase sigma-70 factor (ECF subfamily)
MLLRFSLNKKTDEELMLLSSHGNDKAFEELYNRYARRLQGFFYRQLNGDKEMASDFAHDTFLRVYDARKSYKENNSFATWIFSIAYNLCKNRYRHTDKEEQYLRELDAKSMTTDSPEVDLDAKILQEALQKVLSSLAEEARMMFSLHYEEDLTVAEIAAIYDIPEGTVKSRLHKIIIIIKQKLKQYEDR